MSFMQRIEQGVENRIEADVMGAMGAGNLAPPQQGGMLGQIETDIARRIEGGMGAGGLMGQGGQMPMGGVGGGVLGGLNPMNQVNQGGYVQPGYGQQSYRPF